MSPTTNLRSCFEQAPVLPDEVRRLDKDRVGYLQQKCQDNWDNYNKIRLAEHLQAECANLVEHYKLRADSLREDWIQEVLGLRSEIAQAIDDGRVKDMHNPR